jgi:hypothetical protein
MSSKPQIFLSHAGENSFEARLLQIALETRLGDLGVRVWTYQRDQAGDQREVAKSLKEQVRGSSAAIMLLSPETLKSGLTQWMELAYADAFGVPTFVLLHNISFESLRRSKHDVPPLIVTGHCTAAIEWEKLEEDLRRCCDREIQKNVERKNTVNLP